ncbi:MAG: DUF3450 domain-containing protein [Pseudomonadota bacterium]
MVQKHMRHAILGGAAAVALLAGGITFTTTPTEADELDQIIETSKKTIEMAQAAQQQVNQLSEQSEKIVEDFRQQARLIDNTRIYNAQISQRIANQEKRIAELEQNISEVSQTRQQLAPLMQQMIDRLDDFVRLDMPFKVKERQDRVAELRELMLDGEVSPSETFRKILEAYKIESQYGRAVSNYRGSVVHNGGDQDVEFLQIGRVALVYKAPGANTDVVGLYNKNTGQFEALPRGYARAVEQGLKFAKKQATPSLFILPIPSPQER